MSRRGTRRIDVVVANAGIAHRTKLAGLTDEKWDLTFDIDLGASSATSCAPPRRNACPRRSGAVVALSSIMGVAYGWDEHVHYSAAKSGVVSLVRGGLAVEMALKQGNHRVNGIAPGYIRTAQLLSRKIRSGPAAAEKAASSFRWGGLEPGRTSPMSPRSRTPTARDT